MMSHASAVDIQRLIYFIETPSQNLPIEVIEMGIPVVIQAIQQNPFSILHILEDSFIPATYLLADLADKLKSVKQLIKLKDLFDQCSHCLVDICVYNVFDLERCVNAIPFSTHEIMKTLFANKERYATLLNSAGDPKKSLNRIAEIYPKYEPLLKDQFSCVTSKKFTFKLHVVPLSKHPELVSQVAIWTESAWGYIRKKGVTERKKIINQNINQFYVVTYGNRPNHVVGMFALFDCVWPHDGRKIKEFSYFYIDERLRGVGLGSKVLELAKEIAMLQGVDMLVLDTLNEKLNQFYIKHGAKLVCEGRLFGYPTSLLTISVSMKDFSFSRQQKFFKHSPPVAMQDSGLKLRSGPKQLGSEGKLQNALSSIDRSSVDEYKMSKYKNPKR